MNEEALDVISARSTGNDTSDLISSSSTALASHWKTAVSEFLHRTETENLEDKWNPSRRPKSDCTTLNLRLPKGETLTEARRLVRNERFDHLHQQRKDKIIDSAISQFKVNLDNGRLLHRLRMENAAELPTLQKKHKQIREANKVKYGHSSRSSTNVIDNFHGHKVFSKKEDLSSGYLEQSTLSQESEPTKKGIKAILDYDHEIGYSECNVYTTELDIRRNEKCTNRNSNKSFVNWDQTPFVALGEKEIINKTEKETDKIFPLSLRRREVSIDERNDGFPGTAKEDVIRAARQENKTRHLDTEIISSINQRVISNTCSTNIEIEKTELYFGELADRCEFQIKEATVEPLRRDVSYSGSDLKGELKEKRHSQDKQDISYREQGGVNEPTTKQETLQEGNSRLTDKNFPNRAKDYYDTTEWPQSIQELSNPTKPLKDIMNKSGEKLNKSEDTDKFYRRKEYLDQDFFYASEKDNFADRGETKNEPENKSEDCPKKEVIIDLKKETCLDRTKPTEFKKTSDNCYGMKVSSTSHCFQENKYETNGARDLGVEMNYSSVHYLMGASPTVQFLEGKFDTTKADERFNEIQKEWPKKEVTRDNKKETSPEIFKKPSDFSSKTFQDGEVNKFDTREQQKPTNMEQNCPRKEVIIDLKKETCLTTTKQAKFTKSSRNSFCNTSPTQHTYRENRFDGKGSVQNINIGPLDYQSNLDAVISQIQKENAQPNSERSPAECQTLNATRNTRAERLQKVLDESTKRFYWNRWRQHVVAAKAKRYEEKKWLEKINKFMSRLHQQATLERNSLVADPREGRKPRIRTTPLVSQPIERKPRVQTTPLIKSGSKKEQLKDVKLKEFLKATQESAAGTRAQLKTVERLDPEVRGKAKLIRVMTAVIDNNPRKEEPKLKPFPVPKIMTETILKQRLRRQRLNEIAERKRQIEEERDRIAREKYEHQLMEAAMEKRRKLLEFREKMRRQRIEQEARKQEWMRMKVMTERAIRFYDTNLLTKFGLKPWKDLVAHRWQQQAKAEAQNEKRIMRFFFLTWKESINEIRERKEMKAQLFWRRRVLRLSITAWKAACHEVRLDWQVAEDWHNYKLTNQSLKKWLDFVYVEQEEIRQKWTLAVEFYNRKQMTTCLKQWMLLPQVMYLQREKEQRKRALRETVQQILPDFRPAMESSIEYT